MQKIDISQQVEALSVGQQAALRRSAGKCLRDADSDALQALYSVIPHGLYSEKQEQFFAVLCMMCLWKAEKRKNPKPFALCLKELAKDSSTIEKRVIGVLDTAWTYDEGYLITKLTRLARQLCSNDLFPDFDLLLNDLFFWNSPERYVQRRWMEQFIGTPEKDNEEINNFVEE